MRRIIISVMALMITNLSSAWAASVELGRADGRPGDIVTLILNLNPLALDEFGSFGLDLGLYFNPDKVQYIRDSARKLHIFRGETDDGANNPAIETELVVTPQTSSLGAKLAINLGGFYLDPATAPAGGELISLQFRIAETAGTGEVPLELQIESASDSRIASVSNGAIGVAPVPIPPALLLFGAPIAWMLARRRRA